MPNGKKCKKISFFFIIFLRCRQEGFIRRSFLRTERRTGRGSRHLIQNVRKSFARGSHNHRQSRWLAPPYKGMVLAGLKAL